MRIYDISQEVFGCQVFPGDPVPQKEEVLRMENGDVCNLTKFCMCAHNGTHVDAPYHFIQDGKKINEVALDKFIGFAYVIKEEGNITAEKAISILQKAKEADARSAKRILIKGKALVLLEAARIFAEAGIDLLGNESQTVGPEEAPREEHLELLGAEVVLLEGIRLESVPEGVYFLNASPLNLGAADGAPCRAVLIQLDEMGNL